MVEWNGYLYTKLQWPEFAKITVFKQSIAKFKHSGYWQGSGGQDRFGEEYPEDYY
jgi:hypothetical protein